MSNSNIVMVLDNGGMSMLDSASVEADLGRERSDEPYPHSGHDNSNHLGRNANLYFNQESPKWQS